MALDLDTTYRAILLAARRRTYITYGEIAAANGVTWAEAQSVLPAQLEALMKICHAEGWPFVPAIVFHEPALGHVGPSGTREHLVIVARSLGCFISDANAFIRTEQDRVFDWAPSAPDHLPSAGHPGAAPSGRLDLNTTYRAIVRAARERAFLTYGEIAAASGVVWSTVRSAVPAELDALMGICHRLGWPFLPVIVVDDEGRESGGPSPEVRDRLVGVARSLGVVVEDPQAFVAAQQAGVFAWAASAPADLPPGEGAAPVRPASAGDGAAGPHFIRYFGPVLDALRALGGTANAAAVADWVRAHGQLPAEEIAARSRSGRPAFANRVGWARFYLDKGGFLASPQRGVWALTRKGQGTRLDLTSAREIFREVRANAGWGQSAPDDEDAPAPETGEAAAVSPAEALFADPEWQFWLAGGTFEGSGDQTDRFLAEGIWQVQDGGRLRDQIARLSPGDRIILKSAFTQKRNLPFDNGDETVPVMRLKAVGRVIERLSDGLTVRVDWQRIDPPRDWYFNVYRTSLVALDPANADARQLIRFACLGEAQDIDSWRQRGRSAEMPPASPDPSPVPDLPPPEPYTLADIAAEGGFFAEDVLARALDRWKLRRNLILQGPPGTGKSWLARRLAAVLLGSRDPRVTGPGLRAVQFHPALSYEEFVRGWRPDGSGGLALVDGPFLESVAAARTTPDRPVVLLIEEINRGNPARIFGDMLTLIEDSKRRPDEGIELAARSSAGERIFVPDNLHLIGTMNLADRSLAMVDFALRRRFAFLDLAPAFNERWRDWCVAACGLDATLIGLIQERLTALNEEIAGDRSLGAPFRIGHSFLTPRREAPPADTALWFRETVETEIGPLLEEYWFDSPDRARDAVAALLVGV